MNSPLKKTNYKLEPIFGPKLDTSLNHSPLENHFFTKKNDDHSPIFHNNEEFNNNLENNNRLMTQVQTNYKTNDQFSLSTRINLERNRINKKSQTSGKDKRAIFLLNIFKRAKRFSTKIKKIVFYKKFENMQSSQKEILHDLTEFPRDLNKIFSQKVLFLLKYYLI